MSKKRLISIDRELIKKLREERNEILSEGGCLECLKGFDKAMDVCLKNRYYGPKGKWYEKRRQR